MPTKRKGASKHRQSRRSRRHSRRRRSVRGGMFSRSKSFPTHVENEPFKLIGQNTPSDLLLYTGMKDGTGKYMPGGFVFWRGDPEANINSGWYQVQNFDETNMPLGLAYLVESNDAGPIIGPDGHPRVVKHQSHVIGRDDPATARPPGPGDRPDDVGYDRY